MMLYNSLNYHTKPV